MKIRIELEEDISEDEIIIKCTSVDKKIQEIQQAISNIIKSDVKISFFKENKEYYLQLNEILFFETNENHVDAHTRDDVYTTKYRLYELEEILPYNFSRVSKSTILNINNILSISRNLASSNLVQFYKSHKQVYVSRYYFKDLHKKLSERRNYEK